MSPAATQSGPEIVLVTGANRGIGEKFLEIYVKRDNTTVIAAVRDPNHPTAKALFDLPTGKGSKVITVKYEATSETDASDFVEELKSKYDINHLDTVIANAGISRNYETVLDVPVSEIKAHFDANTYGPVILFKAVWPLLDAAPKPRFVTLSTIFASNGDLEKYPFPYAAYGASKAAANFFVRKIHLEHKNLIAFPINPGWVQTEMGNHGAATLMGEGNTAPYTRDQSVTGMIEKIENSTREKTSGTFQSFDGEAISW